MFYVFGINGPMYRGGPENLTHITPVRGVQRPASLRSGRSSEDGASGASFGAHAQEAILAAYHAATGQGPRPQREPLRLVRDVMTRGALTISRRIKVQEAWDIMAHNKIAQAPVLDDEGRVIGLLLRSDIAPLALLTPQTSTAQQAATALALRSAQDVMVSPVPAVAENTDLRRVARVLMDTGLPGLPVTDEWGTLSGFISRTDILRAVASDPPLDLWG